ncbi:aminotransferase class I/II-fold pyridoxal phosphate-dependent enzyme [Candidatus Microgenomates bacterium]|nr:MAG: aminotransferase class I/II-fold pyridoxal phosphate-dependent enzyme [Candidatus Microgenomates bacterium]
MKRPIVISLSPNVENEDFLASLRMFFSPWEYFKSGYIKMLGQWFRSYFKMKSAITFASGRGALFSILKSIGLNRGDEVILQAFTCAVVPNVIVSLGARPVFVDINGSLTLDIEDFKRKITNKTKAVIVQHTFGIEALPEISKIAKEKKILVIEDCAHRIDDQLKINGDIAFFSFGRDKAFSSVFGGVAITNNEIIGKKIKMFQRHQSKPSFFWVLQQLFHPIAFYFILPFYNIFSLGKIMLVVLQFFHFLSFPVSSDEKKGKLSGISFKKMPNALCYLALLQLKKIKEYNQKREKISNYYSERITSSFIIPCKKNLPFLRFPVIVERRDEILNIFKKKGIYLGKWYSEIIDPKGVDFNKIFYKKGSCPNAEFMARKIINLPTYPLLEVKDAQKIVNIINGSN